MIKYFPTEMIQLGKQAKTHKSSQGYGGWIYGINFYRLPAIIPSFVSDG